MTLTCFYCGVILDPWEELTEKQELYDEPICHGCAVRVWNWPLTECHPCTHCERCAEKYVE